MLLDSPEIGEASGTAGKHHASSVDVISVLLYLGTQTMSARTSLDIRLCMQATLVTTSGTIFVWATRPRSLSTGYAHVGCVNLLLACKLERQGRCFRVVGNTRWLAVIQN